MPSPEQPAGHTGRFVVLEGLDGAGTTTQAALLANALRGRGLRVCLTAEPTDGPLGRVLRAHVRGELGLDPLTAALTFSADRADHLTRVVRPSLARGEWVICDRYILSTLAYQGAEGVDRSWIMQASASFERPDLTFFLDVAPEELTRRLGSRDRVDRYEGTELAARISSSYTESIALLRGAGHLIEGLDGGAAPGDILRDALARLDALGGKPIYP